jgi:hypothetical protein
MDFINELEHGDFTFEIIFPFQSFYINADTYEESIDLFITWAETNAPGYIWTPKQVEKMDEEEREWLMDYVSDSAGTTYINEYLSHNAFLRHEREKFTVTVTFQRTFAFWEGEEFPEEERGFIEEPYYSMNDEVLLEEWKKHKDGYCINNQYNLAEILSILQSENFVPQSDNEGTDWFYSGPVRCIYTGIEVTYTLHIKDCKRNDQVFELLNNAVKEN